MQMDNSRTRRDLLKSCIGLCWGISLGCETGSSTALLNFTAMEDQDDIGILNPFLLSLTRGAEKTRLHLTLDDYAFPRVTTSPDAQSVAWIPRHSAIPAAVGSVPEVFVKSIAQTSRVLRFDGLFAELIAISSYNASLVALCIVKQEEGQVVIVMNSMNGKLVAQFTQPEHLIGGIQVERLSFCDDGARLVIGSRDYFVVTETISGRVLTRQQGRFPALSPDGKN